MGSISPELTMDYRHITFAAPSATIDVAGYKITFPKTITEFIEEISRIGGVSEKLSKIDGYVKRLEDEMRKIDAFKRELPLCMLLLTDAILALKEESSKLNVLPIFEEFLPLKVNCNDGKIEKNCYEDEIEKNCYEGEIDDNFDEDEIDDNGDETEKNFGGDEIMKKIDKDEIDKGETMKVDYFVDKNNWLSSMQLWSSNDDDEPLEAADMSSKQISKPDNKKRVLEEEEEEHQATSEDIFKLCIGHKPIISSFVPLEKGSDLSLTLERKEDTEEELPSVPTLSLQTFGIKRLKMDIGKNSTATDNLAVSSSINSSQKAISHRHNQTTRKQRRCWSTDLHRKFVDALQKLGGCQVATPKQIREVMQVDGLTNDEVKSHLQKYRLHTRRIPNSTNNPSSSVGVLGTLWMAAPEQCYESLKDSSSDGFLMAQQMYGGETSKSRKSQSGSPECHLQLGGIFTTGTSMSGSYSREEEEDDDEDEEQSEVHSRKSHHHI